MKKLLKQLLPKAIGAKINAISLFNPQKAAKQAYYIFSTPRAGSIREEMKPFLDPAKLSKLSVENCTIQTYHWKGSGKKILLIHGWESNTHRWHLLIPELQRLNYDIYAVDGPAQGNSTGRILNVPLYAKTIEKAYQKFNPDYLIGHSLGGLATMFHQYTYQKSKVSGVVILGSASDLDSIMLDYKNLLGLNNRTMRALESFVLDKFGYNFKQFSGASFAKELTSPALIIHDKFDKITPVIASRSIHQNWKGSTYVETEGFGHSLYQKEVRNMILKFLKSLEDKF